MGRTKTKIEDWLTEDSLTRIEGWARDGLDDKQIAHNMGIGVSTYYKWMHLSVELVEAVKKGKAPVDIEVENALLKAALGYDVEETVQEVGDDGKKHIKKVRKHIPPNVTAQIFWLKNRRGEIWREKQQVQLETSQADPISIILKQLESDSE